MDYLKIDAFVFEKMLRNGLANLCSKEEVINNMNVFPVPDGDTGTNMHLTLENALSYASSMQQIGSYLKLLSEGMMLGARGNSGAILCQLFRGIYEKLKNCEYIDSVAFKNALVSGYEYAYRSIPCPVEGTILTVAREGIEEIKDKITESTSVNALLQMYLSQMNRTLLKTPDLLPALKEADTYDSGAAGYIAIVEGMEAFLDDVIINNTFIKPVDNKEKSVISAKFAFNDNYSLVNGYCMEFILLLINSNEYDKNFNIEIYKKELMTMGESLVIAQDKNRIKVHIHTKKPAYIITLSQNFGEFISFKLENMDVQHSIAEYERRNKAQKVKDSEELEILSVVQTESEADAFEKLGCKHVLMSDKSGTVDVQAFVNEIQSINSKCVAVLPNNKNNIEVARLAAGYFNNKRIEVIPAKSVADGYCTFSIDAGECHPVDFRIRELYNANKEIISVDIAVAARNSVVEGKNILSGDILGITDGKIIKTGSDIFSIITECLKEIEDIEDKESCIIFANKEYSKITQDLISELNEKYPLMDTAVIDDTNTTYLYQIGVS